MYPWYSRAMILAKSFRENPGDAWWILFKARYSIAEKSRARCNLQVTKYWRTDDAERHRSSVSKRRSLSQANNDARASKVVY